MKSGGVKCWGLSTNINRSTPVDLKDSNGVDLSGIAQISVGDFHTCALTTSGGIKCWGTNNRGQLGDGTSTDRTTPVDVIGLTSPVGQITAGVEHTCALTTSGAVKCWGYNFYGQLGVSDNTDRSTPVDVKDFSGVNLSGVAQIRAGGNHTCAVTTAGGAKCWGLNQFGAVGDGSTTNRNTAYDVKDSSGVNLSGVVQIGPGQSHTCGLTTNGGDQCWGQNSHSTE